MKLKHQIYYLSVMAAIVMMAMCPAMMWAADVTVRYADGSQKTFGGGLAINSTNNSGIESISIDEGSSVIINADISVDQVDNYGTLKVLKNRTLTVGNLNSRVRVIAMVPLTPLF